MNKTIKVLLADTSDFFGVPCAAALRSHEMDVIQVEKDGRKLLERIEAEKPDAVVLDFFLAGLDAVGVIGQTKKLSIPQPQFSGDVQHGQSGYRAERYAGRCLLLFSETL